MMQGNLTKQRLTHFDLLKGIAIFLVVMGHVLTMCVRGLDRAFIFKLIGQLHMPIFFFISGYFTYKAAFLAPNLKKRFMQLIIPFLAITPLWVWYFPHSALQSPLSDNLPDLYKAYWKDGYWFTLCLFELCALYLPLSKILARTRRLWVQVVVLLLTYGILIALSLALANEEANTDYVGFGLLATFFPIFMMGVMAHRFQQKAPERQPIALCLFIFAVTFYAVVYPWDMPGDVQLWTYAKFALLPLMQAALMVIVVKLGKAWAEAPAGALTRIFTKLGNESLGIYLLHYFFLFPLTFLQEPLNAMGLQFVPMLVTTVLVAIPVIAVTLLVVRILKLSKLTRILFLGQS